MDEIGQLLTRVEQTKNGFTDVRDAAEEVVSTHVQSESVALAKALFESEIHQGRMLATFIFGDLAATSNECLAFLHDNVSRDPDWRVQECLAKAFDAYCDARGYEQALPEITAWLTDPLANVRRAVTEGLRVWTTRPYFRYHPEHAITLLSARRTDESAYVRVSAGNALRDISRKYKALVGTEVATWDLSEKSVAQTYKLASKFLD
jgi:3-methyladenine DNA glycosylase AlkD